MKFPEKLEDAYETLKGNRFFELNKETSGARSEEELKIGGANIQLYSMATPNGQKASILCEELVSLVPKFEYDAHFVSLAGEQFTSGFVNLNPNSKIPALFIKNENIKVFESGSILVYLAEKYNVLIPKNPKEKAECLNWVFWASSGQSLTFGNFGHFYVYAPRDKLEVLNYGIARYGMEVRRLLSVLDNHLQGRNWMAGNEFSIADIAVFPWIETIQTGYKAGSFIGTTTGKYPNVDKFCKKMKQRPAVQQGMRVCSGKKAARELSELYKAQVPKL